MQDSASETNEYTIIAAKNIVSAKNIVCKVGVFRVHDRLWILKPTLMSGHASAEMGPEDVQGL